MSSTPDRTRKGPPAGFSKEVNTYLNHYVTVADTKAGAVVTADLAIIALLVAYDPPNDIACALRWLAGAGYLVSAALGAFVIFPRIPHGGNGLIFWEDIRSRGSAEKYFSDLAGVGAVEVEREYAHQNYHVSNVLHTKYWWGRLCILGAITATVVATIMVIVG